MTIETLTHRGWEIVRLTGDDVQVDVVPGKGGDIIAVRWLPLDVNVLWESPWGLRERGSSTTGADSMVGFLEQYPGGWQTIFPNGGDAATYQGVELNYHGEAAVAPWQWSPGSSSGDGDAVVLTTTLMRSPFELRKELRLDGDQLVVTEHIRNVGGTTVQAMWSHHPAFGAPLLDGSAVVATGARRFASDDAYDPATGDLAPGVTSDWPLAAGKDGATVDLRALPGPDEQLARLGYLHDFAEPWYSITNASLGLEVRVEWDAATFDRAWYWVEAHGTPEFPWFRRAYVFAIEPASSTPGRGIATVLAEGGQLATFEPGEERAAHITLTLSPTA